MKVLKAGPIKSSFFKEGCFGRGKTANSKSELSKATHLQNLQNLQTPPVMNLSTTRLAETLTEHLNKVFALEF